MAVTDIGVGTVANDGTGQTLRAAFQRYNSNLAEYYSQTSGSLKVKQVDITPSGATPTNAEIDSALSDDADDATSTLFILNDLTNSKAWLGLSDGTYWHIVAMTKIT